VNRDAADQGFGKLESVAELLRDCFKNLDGRAGDFNADTIAGQEEDF